MDEASGLRHEMLKNLISAKIIGTFDNLFCFVVAIKLLPLLPFALTGAIR